MSIVIVFVKPPPDRSWTREVWLLHYRQARILQRRIDAGEQQILDHFKDLLLYGTAVFRGTPMALG